MITCIRTMPGSCSMLIVTMVMVNVLNIDELVEVG